MLRQSLRRALSPVLQGVRPVLTAPPPAAGVAAWPAELRRWMGTHGRKEAREPLNDPRRAKEFIYGLQPAERSCLLGELQSFQSMARVQETQESTAPSSAQMKYVLLHNALPFVGFGFLDNAIMIAAGTQIEVSIGVTLGISTMAAAALGNLISDLAGLGLAGYVEALTSRLGLPVPELTPKQADQWQTRVSAHMGKALGVSIGCILGMFPLLFLDDDKDKAVTSSSSSSSCTDSAP